MQHHHLFEQITPHSVILTPNNRLAQQLHLEHAQYLQQNTPSAWLTPTILPLSSWQHACWTTLSQEQTNILLTQNQALSIWERIVADNSHLLQINPTAKEAMKAWQLLNAWRLDLDHPQLPQTENSRAFLRWAHLYQDFIQQHNFIDPHSLSHLITEAFQTNKLTVPSQLMAYGFIELAPDVAYLLNTLEELGCTVSHKQNFDQDPMNPALKSRDDASKGRLATTSSTKDEIRLMAQWAKDTYKKNPGAQIACIIPKLTELRHELTHAFYETFNEDQQTIGDLPFNISAGSSFADVPLIFSALTALKLKLHTISVNELSYCLRNAYLAKHENDLPRLAILDAILRQTLGERISLKQLITALEHESAPDAIIKKFSALASINTKRKQGLTAWAQLFSEILIAWDWPGERLLTSAEFQAFQRWHALLDEFSGFDLLDVENKQRTYQQALTLLNKLARTSLFQAQTKHAHIQVLGLLEAGGLPFDFSWVMGMDHESWPTRAKPNAFLPVLLQRELNMPHASSTRELSFCKTITNQLIDCADQLVFSYSQMDGDKKLLMSPLINNRFTSTINPENILEKPAENTLYDERFNLLEEITDNNAPAVHADEKIRGGTSIFKLQAACPFRAFAQLRLKATAIEAPEPGIDMRSRGLIVHKALELIWRELSSQKKLLEMSDDDLMQLISNKTSYAIEKVLGKKNKSKLDEIELTRSTQLLYDWLNIEKARSPFTVIAQEQWQTTTIDTLSIHIQVDRVDLTESGEHVLIDYKTGRANINDWFGDRPNEPQLPLYAVAHAEPISAMSFAQLRPDDLRFKGISKTVDTLLQCKPLKNDWDEQIIEWRGTLGSLARQFSSGKANVDPKDANKTCQFCQLASLCRVDE